MSKRNRVKQRAVRISHIVFVLVLVAFMFIGGALLGVVRKEKQNIYNEICVLYTYDVFTKMYKTPPAYPCIFSCPGVPLRGYCPEEQAIRLALYTKILEANVGDTLSLALQAERVFSTIDSLYVAILTGDSNKVDLFKNSRIVEKNIEVNMARVVELLQKFVKDGNLKELGMLSTAVEVK